MLAVHAQDPVCTFLGEHDVLTLLFRIKGLQFILTSCSSSCDGHNYQFPQIGSL